ncbi:MAG: ImmA/IrrE family metallo-endopeptidase [Bacillota bacterium]|jgi:Zn-dependent peptidase ImmA (M78 family)
MHWITREIKQLYDQYKTTDPFELVDYLDYILLPYAFRKIRGMLLVKDNITCIGYNSSLPRCVQRAVVYHEIAHCLLHPGNNYFMILENRPLARGRLEYDANRFAVELLLSERRLRPGESVYEFAAKYEVPVHIVKALCPITKPLAPDED